MKRPTREFLEEEVDKIPLKNLPQSGLTAWPFPTSEDGKILADNVLVGAVGALTNVSIVGQTEDGDWYFASSLEDPSQIYENLSKFGNLVKGNME